MAPTARVAVAPEHTDIMHYESREIRAALRSSGARLQSARSGRAHDLQPAQTAAMLQDWQGLAAVGDLSQVGRGEASTSKAPGNGRARRSLPNQSQ